jgi:Ca2+-binding RTX toxin-like protein
MKWIVALLALLTLALAPVAQPHFVGLSYDFRVCPNVINYDATNGSGNHSAYASPHPDLIRGTNGVNCQVGSHPWYDDEINGGNGKDELYGKDGFDALWGGDGADFLSGGSHNDQIWGGKGDDVIHCGPGTNDWASGGGGIDIFSGCENVNA